MLMKIYDISQEVFGCKVFPGDPTPKKTLLTSMEKGNLYNLTEFSMCAHNGTHIDAPFHFFNDGKTIDKMDVSVFCGYCYVARYDGIVTAQIAEHIMDKALAQNAFERILIAGSATVSAEAAEVFVAHNVRLVGNESQTVGPEDAPARVHEILLGNGVALLEGVRLDGIKEGKYVLSAAPLNLDGFDGSPCRAVLYSFDF